MATLNRTKAAAAPATTAADFNGTVNTLVTSNILESLIPQYALIARIARDLLGIDIGNLVPALLILYGISMALTYLYSLARVLLERYWMASITIRDDDDIYDHVMAWLKTQRLTTDNLRLTAETDYSTPPEDEPDTKDGFINFASWWRRSHPRFAPAHGTHWFRHEGRIFEFERSRKDIDETLPWGQTRSRTEETLIISCFGRSTAPIKALLQTCKDTFFAKEVVLTHIHRPAGGLGTKNWDLVASRRSRPIETVVLDAKEKASLLADMDEFLRPTTATWYAERGIPYRRGYLFHGPPGTGKTSLSFAAAGLFGLDVYCLSLMDPTMSEEDLLSLFAELPTRCIVLLEDVDTAGLAKRENLEGDSKDEEKDGKSKTKKSKSSKNKKSSSPDSDSDSDSDDDGPVTRRRVPARQTDSSSNSSENRQGVTLSGLLNAIDGVASHEGRILVLTTNKPDALDSALRRPGRVDREVPFQLATQDQLSDLFLRMYAGSPAATPALAEKFAEQLEDGVWSPAEVQGFLLTRKGEPLVAVDEVGKWSAERGKKKKGKKERKEEKKREKEAMELEERAWRVPWIAF